MSTTPQLTYRRRATVMMVFGAAICSLAMVLQPAQVNALTFKSGEKKSFDKPGVETSASTTMTQKERKAYRKDKSRAAQLRLLQTDWRKVKEDDSYASFRSQTFHSELTGGEKFDQVGAPSPSFDGVYKYDFQCNGAEVGEQSPWDGSSFIIRNGVIDNDRGGAGRIAVEFGTVDKDGTFLLKFFRQSPGSKKYTGRDYLFSGKLGTTSPALYHNRHLSGNFYGYAYSHPIKGGSRDDGKFRYDLGCVGFFEKTADISQLPELQPFDGKSFTIKSRNPMDGWALLDDQGDEVKVEIKVSGDDTQLAKGIVLILPSSGPDMRDEEYYAQKILGMGFASAVVYGADPRYSSKFSASYTSYMQARDAAAALEFLDQKFGLGGIVAVAGSSQGSLAALRTVMAPYQQSYPSLSRISHIVMFNAACPDSLEVPVSSRAKIITFNGRWDNAIPPLVCANMKASSDAAIQTMVYDGGHHFESPFYQKGISDGKHLLANCAITVHANLDEAATVRASGETRRLSKGGSFKDHSNWIIDNCLESGTAEGYEADSATQMWQDLEGFLNQ